jgi:hypothetical protein
MGSRMLAVAYQLGCLRSAIVLIWCLIGCLTGAILILFVGMVAEAVAPDADAGVVGLIALGLGLASLVLVAFGGSVLTIRRIQPWREEGGLPNQANVILTLPPTWEALEVPWDLLDSTLVSFTLVGHARFTPTKDEPYPTVLEIGWRGADPDRPMEAPERVAWIEATSRRVMPDADIDRIELPVGPAIRVEGIGSAEDECVRIASVMYFWVEPSSGSIFVLHFMCPESALTLRRSEFEAIAHTLLNPEDGSTEADPAFVDRDQVPLER